MKCVGANTGSGLKPCGQHNTGRFWPLCDASLYFAAALQIWLMWHGEKAAEELTTETGEDTERKELEVRASGRQR
jgi:hypothetical protein